MKERIQQLNHYQKGLLLFMLIMMLVFAVLYSITISRVGFAYQDTILVPSQENGSTVYAGKIHGKPARFTVSAERVVTFQYGDQAYGPYTVREDPTAIPTDMEQNESIISVELCQGEKVLFRGGVLEHGDSRWLYREDGRLENFGFFHTINGVMLDGNGNRIDLMEPSAFTILELLAGPQLKHKGEGLSWFGAALICAVNAFLILFANELFRRRMSYYIRNMDGAEPTDLELAERHIIWTVLAILALVLLIMGLQ